MSEAKVISHYYQGHDGTRLAVDLYLPEYEQGDKFPAIVCSGHGRREEIYKEYQSVIDLLQKNQYAVLVIELRGNGASFGCHEGFLNLSDGKDIKAVMEAVAGEEWSDGQFGMLGGSVKGFIQDLTMAARPEGLKVIIPCDCNIDFYYQDFPNGASRHFVLDSIAEKESVGIPVDEDTDGTMAKAAWEEHKANLGFLHQYMMNMHRDSVNPEIGYAPAMIIPVWERLNDAVESGVFYYKNGAWFDPGATAAMLCYQIFGGRLLIGPWRHCEIYQSNKALHQETQKDISEARMPDSSFEWEQDYLGVYDAVLKHKGNYLQQPPILYYTIGEKPGKEWKYADSLPFANTRRKKYFLSEKRSGTIESCMDGSLQEICEEGKRRVTYTVNKDITLFGPGMTLDRNLGSSFAKEAEKCLTFTSDAMVCERELTGIPLVDLWVTSSHKDGIFLAVLEEVLPDGSTFFLSDGAIRASHAKTEPNRYYDSLEIPYHPGMSNDLKELSGDKPLQLSFHLEAISKIIGAGSRLRLSVFCGEHFYQQPEAIGDDTPEIQLWMGEGTESFLSIPWIIPENTHFSGEIQTKEGKQEADVYLLTKGIYIHSQGEWKYYPSSVKKQEGRIKYQTDAFTVVKKRIGESEMIEAKGEIRFCMQEKLSCVQN